MIASGNALPRRRKHSQTILPQFYLSRPSHDHHFSLPQLVPLATRTLSHGCLSAETAIAYEESAPLRESMADVCSILRF